MKEKIAHMYCDCCRNLFVFGKETDRQGTIVEIDQVGNLWQYGYYNDTVGYQLFNNLFYDENLWQMTQDAPSANAANWDYGDYALPGRYIYPAASYDSAVTFNAPMDGTVMIASTGAWVGGGSEDGVRIVIYAGNTKIWPTDSEWCDINSSNSNSVTVPEITVALHEGETTYAAYAMNVERSIIPFFKERNCTVQDLERHPKIIQDYYQSLLEAGLSPTTVIRRHANVRKCLQYAFQLGIIKSNPADRVEKPRKAQYKATIYNQEELDVLFKVARGDPLELPIILGAFYGLRRSEVLGLILLFN